ncbi:ankyrin repeat-containing domain protein [Stachybotrys elegans]|uniref:Ankyrin repeat-containing domain protein n=1 Tax=Stachybotrys elegans TaxID=80388 RepID=A0A8K0WTP0_9HYPO|nr:ankyrin repeat-containing domain protein [Stachybotrys elegans]
MASKPAKLPSPKLGLDVILNPEHPTVDIVAIHGLGANPETSWEYKEEDGKVFNWLIDQNGLKKDFPRARVLQLAYGSAYRGAFKMKQYMSNLAEELLSLLQLNREQSPRRALVLLGHSMGGILIAKALCIADESRQRYPDMYESFAGCLFFGTPFNGTPVAEIAVEWSKIHEESGKAIQSTLLPLLEEGNENLRDLKRAFLTSAGKLAQKVNLHCFYEELQTNWDNIINKLANQEFPENLLSKLGSKPLRDFVSRDSATLSGYGETGLTKAHRDLVRFTSFKDPQYQKVREPLKHIVQNAPRIARGRFNCTRQTAIDRGTLSKVLIKLEGADPRNKYELSLRQVPPKPWIVDAQEYKSWLNPDNPKIDSYIWICGSEGTGKTTAATAAIQNIQSEIEEAERQDPTGQPQLLAYFYCDQVPGFSTAEDVLKSILKQLCQQQEVLATYAKTFSTEVSAGKKSASMSIELLWQCLRDMLTEGSMGTMHFVINNIHDLPENEASTRKLLLFIRSDIENGQQEERRRVSTRWFFTSRDRRSIRKCMEADSRVQSIDLKGEKYRHNLQLDLKNHAWTQVDELQRLKNYSKAITYFAGSVIGKFAEDTKWIDVAVVRLAGLPTGSNDVLIRKMLERAPQDFRALLDETWTSILKPTTDGIESIKELLRALILTSEAPTEGELLVLTGSSPDSKEDQESLRRLIEKCKPMLILPTVGTNWRVTFVNEDVERHLRENAEKLLSLEKYDIKLQHGILAMRCFGHVLDRLSNAEISAMETMGETIPVQANAESDETSNVATVPTGAEQENLMDSELDNSDDETSKSETQSPPWLPLPYATVYWLYHASQATPDVAQRLCSEGEAFWKSKSTIREKWLLEYEKKTKDYTSRGVAVDGLNALHVAATVGFPHLVEYLLEKGHKEDIHEYDSLINQPLHLAAAFGNTEMVEQLLNNGALVNAAGPDGNDCTPLAMAALAGEVGVMSTLIAHDANKDAIDTSIGPVVNGAIISGNPEAVRKLIEEGVELTFECDAGHQDQQSEDPEESPWPAPLALAALISDLSMFSAILEAGRKSLTPSDYAKALEYASISGRVEILEKLLGYEELEESCFQRSLDAATKEENWDVIPLLLANCKSLDCDGVFRTAATGRDSQVKILMECWEYKGETISQDLLDSCLYTATDFEKNETVIKLLEFGADPNAAGEEYGNALTAACHDGTTEIVQALLDKGADINAPEGYPLQAAAAQGHLEVVKLLVERGVSIDGDSEKHESRRALQAACDKSHLDVAKFLLDSGADANLGGGRFDRPIFAAIWENNTELLHRLLEFDGLQLDISGSEFNTTPLHLAALFLPRDDVKSVLDANVPVNITDPAGDTALMAAAMTGDHETLMLLLEHGADFTIENKMGMTPLNIAAQLGHGECVRMLAARASAVISKLKEAASEGDETALKVIESEQETRSECMAKEPLKVFDTFEELGKFYGTLDSTDDGHASSGPSNEGHPVPEPRDNNGSMQESSDEGQCMPKESGKACSLPSQTEEGDTLLASGDEDGLL